MKKYIYKILNTKNNKCYVGQTVNFEKRTKGHIYLLKKNMHENPHLQYAWNKYGEENFEFSIIAFGEDYNKLERKYIKELKSTNINYGYNILKGGENPPTNSHRKLSDEDIEKIQSILLYQDLSIKEIALKFKVHKSQILKINNGKSWFNPLFEYPLKSKGNTIDTNTAKNILNDLQGSVLTQKQIAEKYSVSRTCVTSINLGVSKIWRDENIVYPIRNDRYTGSVTDDRNIVDNIIYDLKYSDLSQNEISEKYDIAISMVSSINNGINQKYHRLNETYPIRINKNHNKQLKPVSTIPLIGK